MGNVAYDFNRNNYYKKNNIIDFDFRAKQVVVPKAEAPTGEYDNRAGKKTEVYAIRTDEEVKAMIDVLDKHIEEANTPTLKRVAARNKMLFIVGINVGLRASDLRLLTWDFFFKQTPDGKFEFRDGYSLRPKKTARYQKHVNLHFNSAVKKVISWYVEQYPIDNIHGYVFRSRQLDKPITVNAMCRVVKETGEEAGIKQPLGSHSMRKTLGYRMYHDAENKTEALIILQSIYGHSAPSTTLKYIGISNDEIESAFGDLNIGIDYI